MSTIHERIHNRRIELGLSVIDVANALKVSRATVYRYENKGIEKLPFDIIQPLSSVLHTSPEYLMGWVDNPDPSYMDTAEGLTAYLSHLPKENYFITDASDFNISVKNYNSPENYSDSRVQELVKYFYELSDTQRNEAVEFLRLYVGARPDVRDQIVHLLVSLAKQSDN